MIIFQVKRKVTFYNKGATGVRKQSVKRAVGRTSNFLARMKAKNSERCSEGAHMATLIFNASETEM